MVFKWLRQGIALWSSHSYKDVTSNSISIKSNTWKINSITSYNYWLSSYKTQQKCQNSLVSTVFALHNTSQGSESWICCQWWFVCCKADNNWLLKCIDDVLVALVLAGIGSGKTQVCHRELSALYGAYGGEQRWLRTIACGVAPHLSLCLHLQHFCHF